MKFDDHLAAFLYENKSLTLEGIGTFSLDEKARVPNEQKKEVFYPIEGLVYTYNLKSRTDEKIILYLVKKLGKIEPLIRSDIEYYLSNVKQLLNIGQPYTIAGVGTLTKNNDGTYGFLPGSFLPAKEQLNPERENPEHNYPVKSGSSASRVFIIILIVAAAFSALSGIGWSIFTFIKNKTTPEITQPVAEADTIVQKTDTNFVKKDTGITHKNTEVPPAPAATGEAAIVTGDSNVFKMIFEITKSEERAHSRTAQLQRLHSNVQYDSIPINDSVAYYRLYVQTNIFLADTTRIKDSLEAIFKNKIFMEKNHN